LQTKSENILSQIQVDVKAAKEKDEGELSILIENACESEALLQRFSLRVRKENSFLTIPSLSKKLPKEKAGKIFR